jgi:hypothetical protein
MALTFGLTLLQWVQVMLMAVTTPAAAFAADGERPVAAPPSTVRISFVESFRRDESSTPVSAVGLRWSPSDGQTPPARVLVLVDTPACFRPPDRPTATSPPRRT